MHLLHMGSRLNLIFLPEHFSEHLISFHRFLRLSKRNQSLHMMHDKGIHTEINFICLFADADHLRPSFFFLQCGQCFLAGIQIQRLIIVTDGRRPVTVISRQKISFIKRNRLKQQLYMFLIFLSAGFQILLLKLFCIHFHPYIRIPYIAPWKLPDQFLLLRKHFFQITPCTKHHIFQRITRIGTVRLGPKLFDQLF